MPSILELVLTLVCVLALSQISVEKGDRMWTAVTAFMLWFLMNFVFVMMGFWAAWAGWFVR